MHEIHRLSQKGLPREVENFLEELPYYRKCALTGRPIRVETTQRTDSRVLMERFEEFVSSSARAVLTFLSGGTLGGSKRIPYTREDYRRSVYVTASALEGTGAVANRRAALLHPFAPWAIGGVFLEALLDLGCEVLPLGPNLNERRYARELELFQPEVMVGPVGLLWRLMKVAAAAESPRVFVNAGEPVSEFFRREVEQRSARLFDIYGMAEFDTVAAECWNRQMHLLEEEFFCELLVEEPVGRQPEGRLSGELLLTPLRREAFGVFRYCTGDLVETEAVVCRCGQEGTVLKGISRRNAALHIEGVTVVERDVERAVEDLGLPFRSWQLQGTRTDRRNVQLELVFSAKEIVNESSLELLRERLETLNIDLEDLVRSGVCRVLTPRREPNLRRFRTARGKLARVAWISN